MAFFYYKVNDDYSIVDNINIRFFDQGKVFRLMTSLTEMYCLHVLSGSTLLDINGREVEVKEKDMLFLIGGSFIRMFNKSDDFQFFGIIIGGDRYRNLFDDVGFNLVTKEWINKYYKTECSEIFHLIQRDLFQALRRRFSTNNAFDRSMAHHILEMMLLRDVELYWINNPKALLVPTRKEKVFYEFKKLVEIHFLKERNLLFYADLLQLTPKYLSAVIKEVSGFQFTYWIDEPLITEAKKLLCCSSRSIKEISDELGFIDQSKFGRFFKNITGVSPSVFRGTKE